MKTYSHSLTKRYIALFLAWILVFPPAVLFAHYIGLFSAFALLASALEVLVVLLRPAVGLFERNGCPHCRARLGIGFKMGSTLHSRRCPGCAVRLRQPQTDVWMLGVLLAFGTLALPHKLYDLVVGWAIGGLAAVACVCFAKPIWIVTE